MGDTLTAIFIIGIMIVTAHGFGRLNNEIIELQNRLTEMEQYNGF